MQLIEKDRCFIVAGGNNSWAQNDDLIPTVVRAAGFGALGGALGGPGFALAGGVLGGLTGLSNYYSRPRGGTLNRQCKVETPVPNQN